MEYKKVIEGTFLKRPNRFIAQVIINGKEEELLINSSSLIIINGCKFV